MEPIFDSVLTRLVGPDSPPEDLAHIFELDNRHQRSPARRRRPQPRHSPRGNSSIAFPRHTSSTLPSRTPTRWVHASPRPAAAPGMRPLKWQRARRKSSSIRPLSMPRSTGRSAKKSSMTTTLADFTGTFHDLRPQALRAFASPTEGTLRLQASLAKQFEEDDEGVTANAPNSPTSAKPAEGDFADCLRPDSYVASQLLAATLVDQGSLGILYPSVRKTRRHLPRLLPSVSRLERPQRLPLQTHLDPQPRHLHSLLSRPWSGRPCLASETWVFAPPQRFAQTTCYRVQNQHLETH